MNKNLKAFLVWDFDEGIDKGYLPWRIIFTTKNEPQEIIESIFIEKSGRTVKLPGPEIALSTNTATNKRYDRTIGTFQELRDLEEEGILVIWEIPNNLIKILETIESL